MPLLLRPKDIEGLLDLDQAMQVLESMMIEEVEGDTFHMPAYGGSKSKRKSFRIVGGGLYGSRRMGFRSEAGVQLFDTDTGDWLALVAGAGSSSIRIPATMGLAARYLARPEVRSVGVLGSGRNPLGILQAFKAVRPIERVDVYSPTREHREAFAQGATATLGLPVTARETPDEAIADKDIILVSTASYTPALHGSQLRPGVHVSSMGMTSELDESVYLQIDQFVVPNREQEIDSARPDVHPYVEGQLYRMVKDGRYDPSNIVELGSIIKGEVAPQNGPTDTTLFRDSRGGVGDLALANYVFERAREQGLGLEIDWGGRGGWNTLGQ